MTVDVGSIANLLDAMGRANEQAKEMDEQHAELLAAVKALLAQVHADCLREGEEAVVDAAQALVDRIEAP